MAREYLELDNTKKMLCFDVDKSKDFIAFIPITYNKSKVLKFKLNPMSLLLKDGHDEPKFKLTLLCDQVIKNEKFNYTVSH